MKTTAELGRYSEKRRPHACSAAILGGITLNVRRVKWLNQ